MPYYIGRFAPSPTGPLHIGSLITAAASFFDARHQNGKWLVRIDDIDPLREQPGVDSTILDCLKAHGLEWDDEVIYQSQRADLYRDALQKLTETQQAFYCTCSRKALQDSPHYPGTCRNCFEKPSEAHAIRIRVDKELPVFIDRWQGQYPDDSKPTDGDFVIWRKEDYVSYQLAAAIDDDAQYITHVVRGSDLLESTPKQIYLQQQLKLQTPIYGHIPIICNSLGQKLSKQTYAKALDNAGAIENLTFALRFLNQPIPNQAGNISQLLKYAIENWNPDAIPRQMAIQYNA